MKPTQTQELFVSIKKTIVSFFSILMFVALGVAVFLGISWAGPALQNATDRMFDEGSFHNFQVQFPYGITDSDIQALSEIEGVDQVEAAYQSYQTIQVDGDRHTVKVQSLGQSIDTPIIVEGTLPTKAGEMAFQAESASRLGVNVGDTITFEKDANKGSNDLAALLNAGGLSASASSNSSSGSDASSNPDASSDSNASPSSDSSEKPADSAKSTANESGMTYLTDSTFVVTAIINTPEYAAEASATYGYSPTPSGTISAIAWVTDDTFVESAFLNAHPVVNVRSDSLAGLSAFSDEYKAAAGEIEARITELGDRLGTARYDDLHGQAQKRIDEAQAKIDEGKQEITDGEAKIADAREQLETERAAGEAKLASAYEELQGYEYQKAQGQARLDEAKAKVAAGEALLAQADAAKDAIAATAQDASAYKADLDAKLEKGEITQEEYDAGLDEYGNNLTAKLKPYADKFDIPIVTIDHTNFADVLTVANTAVANYENIPLSYEGQEITVSEARTKLAEAKQQIAVAEEELAAKTYQLNQGWALYYAGQEELEAKTAEAEQLIADGEAKIADARKTIAENEPKLEQAKEQLGTMKKYDWTVASRSHNLGTIEISMLGDMTNNLSYSMAALFIIVGLLVSYFAVSRIVHEQITQIGTKKALGMRRKEITTSFLWYSAIAVIAGAIIGAIVGVIVVEGIISSVLGGMFFFGSYPPYFGPLLFVIVMALELVLVLGATYLACRSVLKKHAIELLAGEKPPEGKMRFYEKWGIWEKLPLLTQTIVNNCVNDKRRMLSTIVGVAGSTALIVTAITLNNDVLNSYNVQYGDVYGFDAITYVASEPADAIDKVEKAEAEQGATTMQAFMKTCALEQPDGNTNSIRMLIPTEEEAFSEIYHVRSVSGGTFSLSDDGAWVSKAYADHFGAKVGDELLLNVGDGMKHRVPILGFYEFWLTYNELVMGRAYYEKEFGAISPNVVLADTGDMEVSTLKEKVAGIEGFDSISDDAKIQYTNFATFSKASSAVVAIYLALAALMAIVVLLNLNVMFINEKKRELIVLMINGFSTKDAKRYIYNDTIVLTAIGIVFGIILGCVTGSITVAAIEPASGSFLQGIDLIAVAVGIVGSALLSFIMSKIALRRIPRFELTDINRF